MVEITENLFVGNKFDYKSFVEHQDGCAIIHACKEQYHRKAVVYSVRACAKIHPEYLIAQRGNRLLFNLVDVENPDGVHPSNVDTAIQFIDDNLRSGKRCSSLQSRMFALSWIRLAISSTYWTVSLDGFFYC